MRSSDAPRKVRLPDGVLRRFRLPEATDEVRPRPARKRRALPWLLGWLALTFVGYQWSEGRVGYGAWRSSLADFWQTTVAPPEPERPKRSPLLLTPTQSSTSDRERAAWVSAPIGTELRIERLPTHGASFELESAAVVPESDVPFGPAPEVPTTQDARTKDVHAGPGCERARLRYSESFLDEHEDPAIVALLGKRQLYAHCRAELMSLRLCALVHRGEAIGVTVQTEPPSRSVGTCAAIVAKTLSYPRRQRPQLVRTEVTFQ